VRQDGVCVGLATLLRFVHHRDRSAQMLKNPGLNLRENEQPVVQLVVACQ
jgi:hypothetical protein